MHNNIVRLTITRTLNRRQTERTEFIMKSSTLQISALARYGSIKKCLGPTTIPRSESTCSCHVVPQINYLGNDAGLLRVSNQDFASGLHVGQDQKIVTEWPFFKFIIDKNEN